MKIQAEKHLIKSASVKHSSIFLYYNELVCPCRAQLQTAETYFSLSPSHLDMRSEEETEKKVELLASVATALARYDFPVPGGPNSRMPLHGVRFPGNAETRSNVCHVMSY